MDKQQNAPVLTPFFAGEVKQISRIWQAWFQKLKTRDDEIRRPPSKTYTTDTTLTTWEFGKIILFNIGTSIVTCNLPTVTEKDLWSWVTIMRMGTGRLIVTPDNASRIEYSSLGGSLYCIEQKRTVANATLQVVSSNQWAIIAGLGVWDVD